MTHEEERQNAAQAYALRNYINEYDRKKAIRDFIAGAEWEKNHPETSTESINKLLDTDIFECGFSARARNCLHYAGVKTVRDLVRSKRTELLKFRNFGKRSITELDEWLIAHGLAWEMTL